MLSYAVRINIFILVQKLIKYLQYDQNILNDFIIETPKLAIFNPMNLSVRSMAI